MVVFFGHDFLFVLKYPNFLTLKVATYVKQKVGRGKRVHLVAKKTSSGEKVVLY